ncbi:MAG: capsid cement protein [Spirulina sp.]
MKRKHVKTDKAVVESGNGKIEPYKVVKFGTAKDTVTKALAASDASIGISNELEAEEGEPCEFFICGIAPVTYGGTIVKGSQLTADANGDVVVAGAGNRIIGIAWEDGVAGNIGSLKIAQS